MGRICLRARLVLEGAQGGGVSAARWKGKDLTRSVDFDDARDHLPATAEESLDPKDWEAFRAEAHRGLDLMIDYLRDARQRKVWQPAPDEVRAEFRTALPQDGKPLGELLDRFATSMLPYANGNTHPLFMGWVHGGGTPVGMVAEMLAAGLNANCGGRDHIAIDVEREITLLACRGPGFSARCRPAFSLRARRWPI